MPQQQQLIERIVWGVATARREVQRGQYRQAVEMLAETREDAEDLARGLAIAARLTRSGVDEETAVGVDRLRDTAYARQRQAMASAAD